MPALAQPHQKPPTFRAHHGLEMTEKQANTLASISPRLRGLVLRAFAGKSLRAAVTGKCWECFCFEDREGIRECTASECPLWSVRPYRKKSKT